MPDRVMPERYLPDWTALTDEANRRRVQVEVRIHPKTEIEDDGTTLRGTFDLYFRNRGGATVEKLGQAPTFDQAIVTLAERIAKEPLPGADTLREELRGFGRRLAMLTPRDVAKKSGADVPIYRIFRDRILPLAWDNLVSATRVEALEDFVRRVGAIGTMPVNADTASEEMAPILNATLAELAAEARGLVAPIQPAATAEEETSGAEAVPDEPTPIVRPARARRSRAKPKATDG